MTRTEDLLREREVVENILSSLLEPLGFQKGRLLPFALISYSLGPGYRHEFTNLNLREVLIIKAPSHSRLLSAFKSQIWRDAIISPLEDKRWRDLKHFKEDIESWLDDQRTIIEMEIKERTQQISTPQDAIITMKGIEWLLAKRGYILNALLTRNHMLGNGRMYSRADIQEAISCHIVGVSKETKLVWYQTDFAEKLGEIYLKAESSPQIFPAPLDVDKYIDSWIAESRLSNTVIKRRARHIRDDSPEEQEAKVLIRRLVNSRVKIRATVENISWRNGWNGFLNRLLLLRNVVDKDGNLLGESFWVNDCKCFQKLEITPGDEIEFSARLERYVKDRQGPPDPLKEIDEESDKTGYRLVRPNKANIINRKKQSQTWC